MISAFRDCSFHEQVLLRPNTHVWCDDGYIHRDNAPALIHYGDEQTSCEEWWVKGLRHRLGKPAFTSENVDMWYESGLLHRIDAPSVHIKAQSNQIEALYSSWY